VNVKNPLYEPVAALLPPGWALTAKRDAELLISSHTIRLQADPQSNDPLGPLYGPCMITLVIVDRVAPEEIEDVRRRNAALIDGLPAQESKNNLKQWHEANADVLQIINSEPTHYADNFSVRIQCRRIPYGEPAHQEYLRIMEALNTMFRAYPA